MSASFNGYTAVNDLFTDSTCSIQDSGDYATLTVPCRGSISMNYAIIYLWLKSRGLPTTTEIVPTEDELILIFNLKARPLHAQYAAEKESILNELLWDLCFWTKQEFLSRLFDNQHAFQDSY
jgi:hypothetical protein